MKNQTLNTIVGILGFLSLCGCKREKISTERKTPSGRDVQAPLQPIDNQSGRSNSPTTAEPSEPAGTDQQLSVANSSKQYSLDDFKFPLLTGFFGSGWCVCRDVGTSPHIGQDINADVEEVSVAVSDGKIKDISFQDECGYAVEFEDALGALWIYRHLDKPSLSEGAMLKAGQKIGIHDQYPSSGCGTGPHLHLERRSQGKHPGQQKEKTKACENGARTCYFDPTIISKSQKLSAPIKPSSSFALTSENSLAPEGDFEDAAQEIQKAIDTAPPPIEVKAVGKTLESLCSARFEPQLISDKPSSVGAADAVHIEFSTQKQETGQTLITSLEISAQLESHGLNICDTSAQRSDCISSFSILFVDRANQMWLLAEQTGLRNRPAKLSLESRVCAPENASHFVVQGKTSKGILFAKEFTNPHR